MQSKIKTLAILIAITMVVACNGENTFQHQKIDQYEGEAVYDDLSVQRLNQIQSNLNRDTNFLDPAIEWSNIMHSRSVGFFFALCNDENINEEAEGSFSLYNSNQIITSRHIPISLKTCPINLSAFSASFAVDRFDAEFPIDETSPPNLWLAAYRLHGLSLIEVGAFEDHSDYSEFKNDFEALPVTLNYDAFLDRDILIAEVNNIKISTNFETGNAATQKTDKEIPPIVIFDRISLPTSKTNTIGPDFNGGDIWSYFVVEDANARLDDQQVKTQTGNWETKFSMSPQDLTVQMGFIPDTTQVSYGTIINSDSESDFKKSCEIDFPNKNLCFTTSIDAIKGTSGGPVVFRPSSSKTKAFIAGLISAGPSQDPDNPDDDWSNPDYSFSNPSSLGDEQLVKAITIDIESADIANGGGNGDIVSSETEKTLAPLDCVGECNNDNSGKMVVFSCAKAFNKSIDDVRWDEEFSSSRAVGFVGGPVNFKEDPSNITAVGSLGLVCSHDNAHDHMSKENWEHLKVIGLRKSFDNIKSELDMFNGANFIDQVQSSYLRVERNNEANTPKYNHRPLPIKICPIGSVFIGARFITKNASPLVGIESIKCLDLKSGFKRDFYLNAEEYGASSEFNQYIGRPFRKSGENIVERECPEGTEVRAVSMRVDNIDQKGQTNEMKGVILHCR